MAFKDIFEQLLHERGINAARVARDLDINPQTISQWKKQNSTPNAATVAKLADYFGVPASFLVGSYNKKSLGEKIRHEREMRSLSQDELAVQVGAPKEDMPKYETGEIEIPYTILSSIADEFGYSTRHMLGEVFEFSAKPPEEGDVPNFGELLTHLENTQKISNERIAPQAISLWKRICMLTDENIKRLFDYLALLEESQRKPTDEE